MRTIFTILIATVCINQLRAEDPTRTSYTFAECEGSLTPYPTEIERIPCPDSLEAVMINHVGRHGSRFPASSANCLTLRAALDKADSLGTLTELGKELRKINDAVIEMSTGRWGTLDSLGMAEQRNIAVRMFSAFPSLFQGGTVKALSSYSPRAMMSMMSFVHQLDRMNNNPEYVTSTGRTNSPLLRPFDIDVDYIEFRKTEELKQTYNDFFESTCPTTAISRALGKDFQYDDADHWRKLAMCQYYLIAGLSAMGIDYDASRMFSRDEYNALWACFNMRQYLQRTASVLSPVPADICSALVNDIIQTTDNFIKGDYPNAVTLRFGHAETIMPLASLLRLPGCYYLTNYFDTVASHWKDFYVVPMASNIQFILFKSKYSSRYYLRTDYNEKPIAMIPNDESLYLPWAKAREYMMRCVPIYARIE